MCTCGAGAGGSGSAAPAADAFTGSSSLLLRNRTAMVRALVQLTGDHRFHATTLTEALKHALHCTAHGVAQFLCHLPPGPGHCASAS